jgi:hypothetical protein
MKIELFQQIFKNPQISDLMKIHPVGPGQTDRYEEANSDFSQFCEPT